MTRLTRSYIFITSVVGLFVFTVLAYRDHFVIFGDSIFNMSTGRAFPVPLWGQWVAARATPEFFSQTLFNVFAAIVGPLFGISHVSDVYTAFMAVAFAFNFIFLSIACHLFVRLFVKVTPAYFLGVALVFHALYFSKSGQPNFTLYFAYDISILLAIWFVLPFVWYAAKGTDPFEKLSDAGAIALVSALGYLVAFSITNAAFFAAVMVVLSALVVVLASPKTESGRWYRGLIQSPSWYRFGLVFYPAAALASVVFDLGSGRFKAEAEQRWGDQSVKDFSLFDGLNYVGFELPAPLFWLTLFAVILFAWLVLAAGGQISPISRKRRLLTVALLLVGLTTYYLFVYGLTIFGSRNYFAHTGFSAFFQFFAVALVTASLLTFLPRPRLSALLAPLAFVIALAGLKSLAIPERTGALKTVSAQEVRGIFSSMYMSYCFGSDRVPVYLRQPKYPVVPIPAQYEKNWFGISFSRVFSQFVVRDQSVRYFPSYYPVESFDSLRNEIGRQTSRGTNRCFDIEKSPYYIDAGE